MNYTRFTRVKMARIGRGYKRPGSFVLGPTDRHQLYYTMATKDKSPKQKKAPKGIPQPSILMNRAD